MKNHVRLLLLLLLSEAAYGQLEKGQGLLTGSFNASIDQYKYDLVSTVSTSTSKTTQIQGAITVNYGRFVRNNVLLGAAISLSGGNQTSSTTDRANVFTDHGLSESITPFARYYWQYGKLLLYAGGGFTLTGTQSESNPSENNNRGFSASLDGQAGMIYPVSNRVGVEVFAHSSNLPVSGSTAGIGLILFTGAGNQFTPEDSLTTFSQLSRGRVVVSTGFSTTGTRETSTSLQDTGLVTRENIHKATTVSAGIGYFIRDLTQIGMYGSYTQSSTRITGYGAAYNPPSTNYVSVTAYIRHYLSKTALTPYAGGSLGLQSSTVSGPAAFMYVGRLNAGLAYLAGRRFIIEAELISVQGSYLRTTASSDNSTYYAAFNRWGAALYASLQPNFTLSYTL